MRTVSGSVPQPVKVEPGILVTVCPFKHPVCDPLQILYKEVNRGVSLDHQRCRVVSLNNC